MKIIVNTHTFFTILVQLKITSTPRFLLKIRKVFPIAWGYVSQTYAFLLFVWKYVQHCSWKLLLISHQMGGKHLMHLLERNVWSLILSFIIDSNKLLSYFMWCVFIDFRNLTNIMLLEWGHETQKVFLGHAYFQQLNMFARYGCYHQSLYLAPS